MPLPYNANEQQTTRKSAMDRYKYDEGKAGKSQPKRMPLDQEPVEMAPAKKRGVPQLPKVTKYEKPSVAVRPKAR